MAGGSVGTIFAELDLDASRYTKGQQALLQSATTTTLNIEQNFKNLGVKSSAEMDLMRAKITNSFDMIANSGKASANDRLRAEEAMHAKLKSLNEQQFGKQTSLIDGLKSHWIAATVAIGAAMVVANKAWDLAKIGAAYEEQKGILNNLSRKYDTTADEIVNAMQKASTGLIAKADLMQVALAGVGKGLKPEQLIELAGAADILADVLGEGGATGALKEITTALETGKMKGLKPYLDSTLDLDTAFGDLASKTTLAEKAQVGYLLTMIAAKTAQAQQTEAVSEAADNMDRMEAKYKDATLAVSRLGMGIVNLTVGGFLAFTTAEKPAEDAVSDFGMLTTKAEEVTKKATKATIDHSAAIKAATAPYLEMLEALKQTVKGREDDTAGAKKDAAEAVKIQTLKVDLYIKDEARKWETLEKYEKEYATEQKKRDEDLIKYEGTLFDLREKENAQYFVDLKKEQEKAAVDRLKAERDIYKDLRGYETEAYAGSIALINSQAAEYRKKGVDEVAIVAWVKNETEKADIAKGKSSKVFMEGVSAGYKEMQRDAMTFGKAGYEIFKTFSTSSRNVLSNVLFDGFKGQTKSFADYWGSFTDSMYRVFADTVARMVMEWATSQIFMKQTWFGNSLASSLGMGAMNAGAMGVGGGLQIIPVAGAGAGQYILGGAGTMGTLAEAGMLSAESYTAGGALVYGSPGYAAALGELGMTEAGVGALGSSAWMAGLSAAAPWLLGGLMADQLLFGGKITSTISNVVSDVVGGIGDVVNDIGSAIGDIFGWAKGGAFDQGNVMAFASGGVVSRPTVFPMARGMGLMGEAGPEAIMPLRRDSNGNLGVAATRGQNGGGFNGVIKIYLDGQEIPGRVKIIADGVVVERNRRGVNSTSRVYQ